MHEGKQQIFILELMAKKQLLLP